MFNEITKSEDSQGYAFNEGDSIRALAFPPREGVDPLYTEGEIIKLGTLRGSPCYQVQNTSGNELPEGEIAYVFLEVFMDFEGRIAPA